MDGVDAALLRVSAEPVPTLLDVVAFQTVPYPDELRTSLQSLAYGEQITAEEIAVLHTSVAVAFANAFHTVSRGTGISADQIDLIGSHGQTVAHVPPSGDGMNLIAGTLQLGPPGMIAALTGVTTVGDFRVGDMALGGQGAPLVPYVDFLLRRSDSKSRVILNIGGIANLTYLPVNGAMSEVVAFDSGPGNMVIDELFRVLYPKEKGYENLNEHIARGRPVAAHVESFMGHPYFERKPPKSAGHREFGGRFAWEFLAKAESTGIKREDVLASAVQLTTRTIHDAIESHVKPIGAVDEIFVTGGGSRNQAIMEELRMLLEPARVSPIDELGISAEAKEAVDFAMLARDAVLQRPNVIHHITGASSPSVLGSISMGRVV